MKYSQGDRVEIVQPGSPYHGWIGEVIYTDREALRVDTVPLWYWGEGDVKEAGFETVVSLEAYPMGTIVETEQGQVWVRISKDVWAAHRVSGFGTVMAISSQDLAVYKVKCTFLGNLPDRR